jgi:hypothetical protein
VFKSYLKAGDTAPLWVSEGGLELTVPGTHAGASGDTQSRAEQAGRVPGSQPGDIREQPDTSAPVSREVSRDAYDAPLSAIRSHADDLGVWLGIWVNRSEPDAHARRCASDAVDAIDAMLRDLHQVRGRLVSEIRAADDATAARADFFTSRTSR